MIAIRKTILVIAAAALTAACTDDLVEQGNSGRSNDGQLQFALTTVEMGRQVVVMGGTRAGSQAGTAATAAGVPDEADRFTESVLEGNNPYGLKVQRMPLPLMGFNQGAVTSGETGEAGQSGESEQPTRAAANEIVKTDLTNFHDSLTIWGFTNAEPKEVTLFDQIILTKVRNWRTSVEWPYNQGTYMRFYAVAPSLENINMMAQGGSYGAPPTLTYTLPENANELVDVLYGESGNVSIKSGPAGSTSTNPSEENLGKDNKRIDMQFRHILTAVRFTQGTIPTNLTVRSISVEGSHSEGTYNPAETDGDTHTAGKWTIAASAPISNFTVETNHQGKGAAGTDDVPIGGAPVLFLLPQKLPVGALLRVVLDEETKDKDDKTVIKPHTLTCDIGNQIWKKGFTVVYKITVGRLQEGYYLDAGGTIELEHSTNAVTSTTTVQSYQLSYDYSSGERVPNYAPVTWTVAGYSETGDSFEEKKPTSLSWLTDFRGNLVGTAYEGGYNAQATLTLAAQEMKYSSDHETVLLANSQVASAIDLSRTYPYSGGGAHAQEPANCYIINRSGSYKIPLVYGNMTKDNDAQKPCFKDHQGNTIKKFRIREQIGAKKDSEKDHSPSEYLWSYTGYKEKNIEQTLRAVLLWKDVEGTWINKLDVLPNPTTGDNTDCGEIQFTVNKSTPGNAVIALQAKKVTYADSWDKLNDKSENTYGDWETLWTWHIWMTDEVYQNEGQQNGNSFDAYYINGSTEIENGHYVKGNHEAVLSKEDGTKVATIMPVNLGWVPDQMDFGRYEPRSVWVKLKQTGSTNETVVKITQHARQQLYTGTGTVYQWGRPTAFPAVRNVNGTERPIYDIDNKVITEKFVLEQAKSGDGYGGDAISNTYGILQWEDASNSWFDVKKSDYATANAMWNSTTKTVYDPCPPGFRVPPVSIFTGFSKTGETVVDETGQLNMWPDGTDGNNVEQKSGERLKGGYFYCKANETERYAPMVYMPATGEWHGNKSVGTELRNNASSSSEQLNQVNGIFWTSDYVNNGDNKAAMLWITPDNAFSGGTKEKPVIGFFGTDNLQDCLSSVRGIRPMKMP